MRFKYKIGSLFFAASLLLTGCSGAGAASTAAPAASAQSESGVAYTKHTLAVSAPITGNNAQYGIDMRDMAQMAVDEFNAAGGFGDGQKINLVIYDDKGDANEGINVANLIAENEDVFAVVASFGSTVSMAQAPIFEQAQLPMLSPNSSHIDFPGMGDMMIPLNPTSANSYDVIAKFFYDNIGTKLAILYQNTEQGTTASGVLKENFESLGGTVTSYETYVPGETNDFTALLAKARESEPDALFINGDYMDASKAVLQWKEIPGTENIQLLASGNCLIQSFFDVVGDKANGIVFSSTSRVYSDSVIASGGYNDYTLNWVQRVKEQYPQDGCDNYTAAPYDCAVLALDAAKKVGTADPVALAEKVREFDHDIVSADSLSFEKDENGVYQLVKSVSSYIVENGQVVNYQK